MVNIDLARIPAVVREEFESCESCEMIRKPRAWICDYHSGFWAGFEEGLASGSSGGAG